MALSLNFATPWLQDGANILASAWQRALVEIAKPVGAWASWAPTFSGSGGMTVTSPIINYARFLRAGSSCTVSFYVAFTTSGTLTNGVIMTLPAFCTTILYVPLCSYGTYGATAWIPTIGQLGDSLILYAGGNDGTNYSAGAHNFSGSFTYECQ